MVGWVAVVLTVANTVSVCSPFKVDKMPSLVNNKQLTVENINKNIGRIDSTLQGSIHERAREIQQELTQGAIKQFQNILDASVGNLGDRGQASITFLKQVTALTCLPELLEDPSFPSDVRTRALDFLQNCKGNSIGSLTDSAGLEKVRRHIAEFIQHRDHLPAHWKDIIIVPGVSAAVKLLSKLMALTTIEPPVGIMVPVPEFSLFTDAFTDFGVQKINYYLNEENGWSLDYGEMDRCLANGKQYCFPRSIVVVNPGNPTGQVISRQNIENLIRFAHKEKLLIIACEVYQDNVYDNNIFHSVKKVMVNMGTPFNQTELVSLMSCSKGYAGESGLRGGYMELFNINPGIKELLFRGITISDSPPVCAQIALDCITNPPQMGHPSYPLFYQERGAVLKSLVNRARMVYEGINSIPGLSCNPIQGSFYAFVKVEITEKAKEKAQSLNMCPSTFYAFEMLERTGVVTLPGEGFGQKQGTYHFRITILLEEEGLQEILQRMRGFHQWFSEKYK